MSLDDKYTYPGSGGALINARGITDPVRLDHAMNDYASVAMAELLREEPPVYADFEYLRSMHTRLFERLIPSIAGKTRDVDVQATGAGIPYCRPEYIVAELTSLSGRLEGMSFLTGLQPDQYSAKAAEFWSDLTAIHPFRDGNTRTQSFFMTMLTENAGYSLDWTGINVDELREVRLRAVIGSHVPLARLIEQHLRPDAEKRRYPHR